MTINDIAQLAGVAKSTVSRYLNGGSVSRKTREKLDEIVRETGYSPNTFAQSLKAKRTNIVGTIIPRLDSYSSNEILEGIDQELWQRQLQLIITNSDQNVAREIENIYALARQKADAIILFGGVITNDHLKVI
ncbi:MAG TPA: LacI family DNA-binding transcriptional regulator, partial [Enterococcus aquimarinus]|nr:LacI family DNA-binding transcriptional regulator [Enterococcus aquimarinus]